MADLTSIANIDQARSHILDKLGSAYSDGVDLQSKNNRVNLLIDNAKHNCSETEQFVISRCPGRVSFSKHCDYVNNQLLYLTDDRDIFCLASKNQSGKIKLINQDKDLGNLDFTIFDQVDKKHWGFYVAELLNTIKDRFTEKTGITLIYNSDLPYASGLSSSHALLLSSLIAINELFDLAINKEEMLELCQKVEAARGFNSGLGDQTAQLYGAKNQILSAKLKPTLKTELINYPKDLAIISAPSFIKAEKSSIEFAAANINITAYKLAAISLREEFLGDLLDKENDQAILKKLEDLPELVDEKSIKENGNSNQVDEIIKAANVTAPKEGWPIKSVALYGLAEGARTKELSKNFNSQDLGKHLNLSHQAEQNYEYKNNQWQKIQESKIDINKDKKLAEHIGNYSASTQANDELQKLATDLDYVYGSSIAGAGLGGNNVIACQKGKEAELVKHLIDNYYSKLKDIDLSQVHIVRSSNGAELLS